MIANTFPKPFTYRELDQLPVPQCVMRSFVDAVLRATNIFKYTTGALVIETEYHERMPCRCEEGGCGP